MAREKKPVHKVQMIEGKRNIIRQFLQEYEIESAQDIQDIQDILDALKDLLGGTIKEMIEGKSVNTDFPSFLTMLMRHGIIVKYCRTRQNENENSMDIFCEYGLYDKYDYWSNHECVCD